MRNRIPFGLLLVTFTAVPLSAYQLALKDGRTVQFEKYHATETTLFCLGSDGKETSIPLADVDLDRTQKLNADELVPLDLPGSAPLGNSTANEPSVAEMARKSVRVAPGRAKRTFTDDDIAHAPAPEPAATRTATAPASPAPPKETQPQTIPIQKLIDQFSHKSQSELAKEAVGDAQFSGRDAWEQKLYAQAQRVLRFALNNVELNERADKATDLASRERDAETAKNFEWQANFEETAYNQIAADGAKMAAESPKQAKESAQTTAP